MLLSASIIVDTVLFPYDIFQTGRGFEAKWNEEKTIYSCMQYDKADRLDGKSVFRYNIPKYRQQLKQVIYYKNGKKEGVSRTISTDGTIFSEGIYRDDSEVEGTFFQYRKESPVGGSIIAYSNGKMVSENSIDTAYKLH